MLFIEPPLLFALVTSNRQNPSMIKKHPKKWRSCRYWPPSTWKQYWKRLSASWCIHPKYLRRRVCGWRGSQLRRPTRSKNILVKNTVIEIKHGQEWKRVNSVQQGHTKESGTNAANWTYCSGSRLYIYKAESWIFLPSHIFHRINYNPRTSLI